MILDMLIYTESVDGSIIPADTQALMQELLIEYFGMDMSPMMNMSESYGMGMETMATMSPMGASVNLFKEMLPGEDVFSRL